MIEALKEAGVRNYSIFRHGLTLFGYFETGDLEHMLDYLRKNEVNRRWGDWMAPVMNVDVDPATDFPYLLPLQWHME
jgi:L-rhamnose mutarotase